MEQIITQKLNNGTYTLSNGQAKEFAICIFSDITDYIANHQKDFEDFLETEESWQADL